MAKKPRSTRGPDHGQNPTYRTSLSEKPYLPGAGASGQPKQKETGSKNTGAQEGPMHAQGPKQPQRTHDHPAGQPEQKIHATARGSAQYPRAAKLYNLITAKLYHVTLPRDAAPASPRLPAGFTRGLHHGPRETLPCAFTIPFPRASGNPDGCTPPTGDDERARGRKRARASEGER